MLFSYIVFRILESNTLYSFVKDAESMGDAKIPFFALIEY